MKKAYPANRTAIFRVRNLRAVKGFLYGKRQRLVLLDAVVASESRDHSLMCEIYQELTPYLPANEFTEYNPQKLHANGGVASLQIFSRLVASLQQGAGGVVVEHPYLKAIPNSQKDRIEVLMYLPTLNPGLGIATAKWLLRYCDDYLQQRRKAGDKDAIAQDVEVAFKSLERFTLERYNPRQFIQTAHGLGIPYVALHAQVIQYGYGRGARLFSSSISDETSAIGMIFSKDKFICSAILRMAGIPVARHARVENLSQAKMAALEIGYPVVIKPSKLDNGIGVFPNVLEEKDLEHCFTMARKHSENIVIENHVPGDTYRVVVVKGQVISTWIRRYPTVTGDGRKTIEAFILEMNAHEYRAHKRFSDVRPIEINQELEYFLGISGRSLSTILKKDETVRLSRISNWSCGGDVELIEGEIHPDNASLCCKAAAILNLDIAGIDIIIDDIGISWREAGCAICEVNAQPQLDDVILDKYCEERASVVLTVGTGFSANYHEHIWAQVIDRDACVVWGQINLEDLFEDGFPLAYIDILVLSQSLNSIPDLQRLLRLAEQQGVSEIIISASHPLSEEIRSSNAKFHVEVLPSEDIINERIACLEPRQYMAQQPNLSVSQSDSLAVYGEP